MSLPWYKRWTFTRDYPLLRRVSLEAAAVFLFSDDLAHECGADGVLSRADVPLTLNEIREELRIEAFTFARAAKELFAVGLWEQGTDGRIAVAYIEGVEACVQPPIVTTPTPEAVVGEERATQSPSPRSSRSSAAARMKALREKKKAERLALKAANGGERNANALRERVTNSDANAFANGANDRSENVPPHTPQETRENDVLEDSKIKDDEPKGSITGANDANALREQGANALCERTANDANANGERSARTANGKAKNTPTVPELPPDVDFGDLEPDVALYIAAAAEENQTGAITPSRTLKLRRELWKALQEVDSRTAFAYGLSAANTAGAPNVNYVRKAAKGKKAELETPPPLRYTPQRPEPPHNPDHDMIPDPIDPSTTNLAELFSRRQR